jgi:uncharacterized protein (TIGR02145 family)
MRKFSLLFLAALFVLSVSSCKKEDDDNNNNNNNLPDPDPVTDIDGNVYETVRIGTQIWTAENLKVTRYANGDSIVFGNSNVAWNANTSGAFCFYDDSIHNVSLYGLLYNWYAVNDSRKICPTGYHYPTYQEWQTFVNKIGGTVDGTKTIRAPYLWNDNDSLTSNSNKFFAVPGGYRDQLGAYHNKKSRGFYWTANEATSDKSWFLRISTGTGETIEYDNEFKNYGYSCRCVKD